MRLFSSGICACISSVSLVPLETLGGEDDIENKLLENFFFSERKTKVVLAGLPICRCCLFESKNILTMDMYILGTKYYISKMGFYGEAAVLPIPIRVDSIQFVTILMLFYFSSNLRPCGGTDAYLCHMCLAQVICMLVCIVSLPSFTSEDWI